MRAARLAEIAAMQCSGGASRCARGRPGHPDDRHARPTAMPRSSRLFEATPSAAIRSLAARSRPSFRRMPRVRGRRASIAREPSMSTTPTAAAALQAAARAATRPSTMQPRLGSPSSAQSKMSEPAPAGSPPASQTHMRSYGTHALRRQPLPAPAQAQQPLRRAAQREHPQVPVAPPQRRGAGALRNERHAARRAPGVAPTGAPPCCCRRRLHRR